jgi:hypothetical protein
MIWAGILRRMPRIDEVPVGNSGLVAVEFDRALLTRLRPEAAARGTTVRQLIRDLVETVVADRLVTAVLDDSQERPARRSAARP